MPLVDRTMKAVVISLHFSPAHASHIAAYGMLLHNLGFDVSFLVDDQYAGFYDFSRIGPMASASTCKVVPGSTQPDIALFYNAAVRNAKVARNMRKAGTRILYVFHEPIPLSKRLGEGLIPILKLAAATTTSLAMLKQSDTVVLSSEYARAQYERYYMRYNRCVGIMPLVFDDECGGSNTAETSAKRTWFSYLGSAIEAHHFKAFVEFAKYSVRTKCAMPFALATKSDLTELLRGDKELARYAEEGTIRIQQGRVMSNEEMNRYYQESCCIWNVYQYSTQSGVLARAFMTGTPVLANRLGSFPEYVQPGVNGEFIDGPNAYDEMLQATEKIRDSIETYVVGARQTFLERFYYKANQDRLAHIIGSLPKVAL